MRRPLPAALTSVAATGALVLGLSVPALLLAPGAQADPDAKPTSTPGSSSTRGAGQGSEVRSSSSKSSSAPGQQKSPGSRATGRGQDGSQPGRTKSRSASGSSSGGETPGRSGASKGRAGATASSGSTTGSGQGTGTGTGTGATGDPSGNNGTVKITRVGDTDGTPNNVAHPGCTFQVEWYGFDEGDDVVSRVRFTPVAPTADATLSVDGPLSVPVGGDPATGAGTSTGLDGRETYTLGFTGEPSARQGYHVKVTVTTPRSRGNDTKSKVFWVEPCTGTGTGTGTSVGTGAGDGSAILGTEVTAEDGTTGAGQGSGGGAAARSATGDDAVPTAVDAGEQGVVGSVVDAVRSPWGLALIALGVLAGVGAVLLRRRAGASAGLGA